MTTINGRDFKDMLHLGRSIHKRIITCYFFCIFAIQIDNNESNSNKIEEPI